MPRPKSMILMLLALSLWLPSIGMADEADIKLREIKDVSINDLIESTQFMLDDPDTVTMAWWLPDEFWAVSLAEDPTTTPEGAAEIIDLVSQYTLVIYVDGKFGPLGGVQFVQPDQLRTRASLQNSAGEVIQPLEEAAVSPDMMLLVGAMRPVISNMLGPFGQNMSFVIFPRKDSEGNVIADATIPGGFTMKLGDTGFPVTTPLPSLLAGKTCGTCERDFRGDYSFCPYDRAELQHSVAE